jgi:phage/conjugal plasmid C-4 type zinc finger TraR family protein
MDEHHIEAGERTAAFIREGTIASIRSGLCGGGSEDCADCGEPIGAARRAALPSATRCIGCQDALERRQRGRA